jgi:sulfate adenylyltransferase
VHPAHWVRGERIFKNGGIAICAPIAPYASTRRFVRETISPVGGYIEIYVATPLEVREQRDRKGLCSKRHAGIIKEFTGIRDSYEIPENAETVIGTIDITPDLAAHRVLARREAMGFMK